MKITVQAVIEVDPAYGELKNKGEKEWFDAIMNDSEGTMLILWSNDVGDEIGSTTDFKYELINQLKQKK